MAETTSKSLTNAERKNLPRSTQDIPIITSNGIQECLQDIQLENSSTEEWSKEFDR